MGYDSALFRPAPAMRLLYDFFPLLAFFIAYKFYGIFPATAVIIVAAMIQIAVHWVRKRRVSPVHLGTAALILVFGGVTLLLGDPIYIQWKPTVLTWLFATVLISSQLIWKRPVIRSLMQRVMEDTEQEPLPFSDSDWRAMNMQWALFFVVLGLANLYVVYNFSEDAWVNFKLFGTLGLTLVFAIGQSIWMTRKLPRDEDA